LQTWLGAGIDYAVSERDTRGYVPEKGWAHATAHTADLLGVLAAHPALATTDLERILTAIANQLAIPTTHVYINEEDERLAAATIAVLSRDLLKIEFLTDWLRHISRPIDQPDLRWRDLFADEGATIAGVNIRAYLRSLYFQLLFADEPPAIWSDMKPALEAALRDLNAPYYD
jgi:hypothetical protein